MPAFFTGDELGAIKHVRYAKDAEGWKPTTTTLFAGGSEGKGKAVQKLVAFTQVDSQCLLATAHADGSAAVFALSEESTSAETVSEWKETRLKEGQRYVGLAATSNGIYSCTSNGALRVTKPNSEDTTPAFQTAVLPMRLTEWRLSENAETFAYAGEEVELSLWDTERAFADSSSGGEGAAATSTGEGAKKRKRSEQLLPGELWRAKNLANDELNLRQPVRNTAFTYLQPSVNPSNQHLLVGTQFGDVRRYDTRVARKPVSNWKGIGKTGGIGVVEVGLHEHEVFVSDRGCNLFALDLRNGKISYGYKGLAGAVTSIASSGPYLASGSQDRFLRLHSTFAPPTVEGQHQEHKGDVLDKLYIKVIPTCIVNDPTYTASDDVVKDGEDAEEEEKDDDAVWEGMEEADSDAEEGASTRNKKRKTKSIAK
ncbi:hypothetical protein EIP91_004080 [Steccherinum ochraceum]|uniref:Ribosome biogenesis protein NSA1 n=1 Tax=Steccherinum ochraceum TaxID=92696 RepID=A0A4R0RFN5_9APHY|nr:hypothetical protein EIP91_004080 [Steccherinum ochraceum]